MCKCIACNNQIKELLKENNELKNFIRELGSKIRLIDGGCEMVMDLLKKLEDKKNGTNPEMGDSYGCECCWSLYRS